MRLVFDPDFSSGAWPGPLHGRDATAGERWIGPDHLVEVLETALGLPAPRVSGRERAALLVATVAGAVGFWSESARVDAFGSARRLLDWRDQLAMAGWCGAGREPRLRALGEVVRTAAPGLPDRLVAIAAALERRSAHVDEVRLLAPAEEFDLLWRRIFAALERRGTRIESTPLAAASAEGDLAHARAIKFDPQGDGSLLLLRPAGPLQAAEEVAAWLAARGADELGQTVVIGADPLLDGALRRHGLPTLGTSYAASDGALLQILPLVLEMAWQPQDPQRAFELLSLRPSLVPAEIAYPLRKALREWPAVDSDMWRESMAEGLAKIVETERRARVEARLALLWRAEVVRGAAFPAVVAVTRTELLRAWLARLASVTETPAAARAALAQCGAFLGLVRGCGLRELTPPLLQRFLAEATEAVAGDAPFAAQAGLAHVSRPGAIAGAARHIVWWSFDQRALGSIARLPLSRAERDELAAQGVDLPPLARLAAVQAQRWQRPLLQATRSLLFVCPGRDESGELLHPHPLWDELLARLDHSSEKRNAAVERLVKLSFADRLPRARREALALSLPRRHWNVTAGRIARRERESPSSVESFLGCSFRWTLDYSGKLREAEPPHVSEASDPRLLGSLLHKLIERLFTAGASSREEAEARAAVLFDREAPRLAAVLWLPGAETVRAQARRALVKSAAMLAALLRATGASVVASEQAIQGRAFGTAFEGTPDILIGAPTRVVDLKWGGASYRRKSLANGTALQLAAYSFLGRDGGGFPPVAYLIMSAQRLLTTSPTHFPGAEPVTGAGPEQTWRLLDSTHSKHWARLRSGRVEARGIATEDAPVLRESKVDEDEIVLAPPCEFCSFGSLCGRSFTGTAE